MLVAGHTSGSEMKRGIHVMSADAIKGLFVGNILQSKRLQVPQMLSLFPCPTMSPKYTSQMFQEERAYSLAEA